MFTDAEYFKGLKKYILFILVIFIFSMMIGVSVSITNVEKSKNVAKNASSLIPKNIANSDSNSEKLFFIIKNNIINSFIGIIGVGIPSVMTMIANGYIFGVISSFYGKDVIKILPHFIIEMVAIIINAAIGLRLGHETYAFLMRRKKWIEMKQEIKKGILFYIRWIIPMIIVAAIIEVY